MASFVVAFGWTPTDYYLLTPHERNAIVKEMNRRSN